MLRDADRSPAPMLRRSGRRIQHSLLRQCPLLLVLLACGKSVEPAYVRGKNADIDETNLNPMRLQGTAVLVDDLIGKAQNVAIVDSTLWIGDLSGAPFIHLINMKRHTPIRSLGRIGEGPGDFKSAAGFTVRPGDSAGVWVFDITGRRLTRLAIDSATPPRVMAMPGTPWQVQWLDQRRLVMETATDTARFELGDSNGTIFRHAAAPLLGNDSISLKQRLLASQVRLCTRADGAGFAVVYLDAGRIEMYDALLKRTSEARVPYPSNGVFTRDAESGVVEARSPRTYYVTCAATANYLFAVFSGRHGDFAHHVWTGNSRFVHVFDWGGRFVRALQLDHDADAIAVVGDSAFYTVSVGSDTVHYYHFGPTALTSRP